MINDDKIRELVKKICNAEFSESENDYWLNVLEKETGLDISDYIYYPDMYGLDMDAESDEIAEKYGVKWDACHVSRILSKEIPTRMAYEIKRYHINAATPDEEKKECARCHRLLPLTGDFFIRNKWRNDGFSKYCKECDRQSRIRRGLQNNDGKFKDPLMY